MDVDVTGLSLVPATRAVEASEAERWRQWKRKGRDEDEQFRRRLRTVLVGAAALVAVASASWFALQLSL